MAKKGRPYLPKDKNPWEKKKLLKKRKNAQRIKMDGRPDVDEKIFGRGKRKRFRL